MKELKVSKRYARALFEVARDGGTLEATGKQLFELAELFRTQADASAFVVNVLAADADRGRFVDDLMKKVGTGDLLQRFVRLLLVRRRIALLPIVEEQYKEMAEQHLGILSAEVEVARPLDAETRERLQVALSRYTRKSVQLTERHRPELIAGLRIRLGSLLIDGTLERQLSELNRAMLG